jgi:hypothetical protein
MRILIKATAASGNGAETVLCDGPTRGVNLMMGPLAEGCEIDDQHNIQPAEGLRWASTAYHDRLNAKVAISFQVVREHISPAAAHAWQIQFHKTCVRSGTLYISEGGLATFPNAVLNLRTKPLGVSRLITFTITAGAPI